MIFLAVLLVGLNAASYVEREKTPDIESNPNRSTYNAGATGTRALYELLAETGRRPARWQEPTAALGAASSDKNKPSTFVVVGRTRREYTDKEIEQLLRWVSTGGRLVIIDREPPSELIKTTANWDVSVSAQSNQTFFDDSSDQRRMTENTAAAKPVQPTIYTRGVSAVQPSKFASGVLFEHFADDAPASNGTVTKGISTAPPPPAAIPPFAEPPRAANSNQNIPNGAAGGATLNAAPTRDADEDDVIESPAQTAPVAHLADADRNLLVDFPFGSGQITVLSDPFVVSNGGINLVDNAQLAVNILTARAAGGVIAFDEYHQGADANGGGLSEYFAGTPIAAIALQALILIVLIFLAQSLRFARALPEAEPNRLSKLEYVSAMAQLQQRTKAFDLAIENIYTDFRRRASRLLGADNFTVSLEDLARLIAERANENAADIENLMFKCEEIIRGEPTNKKGVLDITSRLRGIEQKLGLKRNKAGFERL